jgi:hypothetical protein
VSRSRYATPRVTGIALLVAGYLVGYFPSTSYHRGSLGGPEIHHRIFRSRLHLALYRPLTILERTLREPAVEWYAEAEREGAWLPPSIAP